MATTDPTTKPRLTQHRASAILPPMPDDDFTALMNDIKTNGQRLPIMVHDDQVLDGWHRYRACQQLGIDPKLEEFTGDPVSVVQSLNLKRRHLTESQRAMVAAELANLAHGGDRRSSQCKGSRDPLNGVPCSIAEAAKKLAVGPATVKRAKMVLKHGTPSLIEEVKLGKTPVAKAVRLLKPAPSPEKTAADGPAKSPSESGESSPPPGASEVTTAAEQEAASSRKIRRSRFLARTALVNDLKTTARKLPRDATPFMLGRYLRLILDGFRQLYPYEGRQDFIEVLTAQIARANGISPADWVLD